ncbi:hypothetical protein [Streptosporangium sp. KLBMP 9127]|nr:hypothetical protein [Streptosporangium sp. KLBMP 9127]
MSAPPTEKPLPLEPAERTSALEAMMVSDDLTAAQADASRWRYGFYVVITGLVVVLVAFGAAVFASADFATLFAGVCGVAGTITGAYFGVQAGQSGKARTDLQLQRSHELSVRLAAHVGAHNASQVINEVMGSPRKS